MVAAAVLVPIARKVDRKKTLVGTMPFVIPLLVFLFVVYNQRFAQSGFFHLQQSLGL